MLDEQDQATERIVVRAGEGEAGNWCQVTNMRLESNSTEESR